MVIRLIQKEWHLFSVVCVECAWESAGAWPRPCQARILHRFSRPHLLWVTLQRHAHARTLRQQCKYTAFTITTLSTVQIHCPHHHTINRANTLPSPSQHRQQIQYPHHHTINRANTLPSPSQHRQQYRYNTSPSLHRQQCRYNTPTITTPPTVQIQYPHHYCWLINLNK